MVEGLGLGLFFHFSGCFKKKKKEKSAIGSLTDLAYFIYWFFSVLKFKSHIDKSTC